MDKIDFDITEKENIDFELDNSVIKIHPELESISINPSKEERTYKSEIYYGFDEVKVNKVTSEADANITPENIKEGVNILGTMGTANLLVGEELTIDKNGEYTPIEPINAYTKVIANVPNDTSDATATAEDIASGKTAYISSGLVEGTGNMAQKIEKGLVINSYDEDGYPTDISIVGMTEIPNHYFYAYMNTEEGYIQAFSKANINLPDNLETIGNYSFYGCDSWVLTSLPSTLKTIGEYGFYNCLKLAITELPNSIIKIGRSAFAQCSNLALKNLPSEINTIEERSFYNCANLVIQVIPSKVTSIGANAFYNCSSINNLSITGAITSIGSGAFYGCANLSVLRLRGVTKVPTISSNSLTNTPIAKGTGYIYVPTNLLDSFKSATNWSKYADRIYGV